MKATRGGGQLMKSPRALIHQPEIRRDLYLTGANLPDATGEQEESYDRPVIEFFDKALR